MKSNSDFKILFTGGHLTPALAVIDELEKNNFKRFVWVGRNKTMASDKNYSAEYDLITKKNIPFVNLISGKIIRFYNLPTFLEFLVNIVKIPISIIQSIFILLKYRPDIVVSFGGYIGFPIVFTSYFLSIPSIIHEQTVVSGLANKFSARFADRILISWEDSRKFFNNSKTRLIGNPIRKEIFSKRTNQFIFKNKLPIIYITGGNQGSHIINKTFFEIIPDLLKKFNIIHQTGDYSETKDYEEAIKLRDLLKNKTLGEYIVFKKTYGEEIGEIFDKTDILVSRSGANIISEILALGKISILIPISKTYANEQFKNALLVSKTGLAEVLEEKKLNATTLLKYITRASELISEDKGFNTKNMTEIREKAKSLIRLDSAEKFVEEIKDLLNKHK